MKSILYGALLPLEVPVNGARCQLICKLFNEAKDYAWGSDSLIPDYFGIPATGKPMAEIWFGTHPGSITKVLGQNSEQQSLLELRKGSPLPFLLKILAAGQPLSIQAHPNKAQAAQGFGRENKLGLALDDANRDYKDDQHKPEMIVALTDFVALTGFRPVVDTVVSFQRIVMQAQALGFGELESAFANYILVLRQWGIESLFTGLLKRPEDLAKVAEQLAELAKLSKSVSNIESKNLALVPQLQELYPGDPGVVISQLMNVVELAPLQAVELGAGNIHAYISGLGIEIMAASDNVLRGGLTPKRINVEELTKIVDYAGEVIEPFVAQQEVVGLYKYPSVAEDYLLYRVEVGGANLLADLKFANPAIFICTSGEVAIGDSTEHRQVLVKGEAAYLADAKFYNFSGSGTGFLATW